MKAAQALFRYWNPVGRHPRKKADASPTKTEQVVVQAAASAGLPREEIWAQVVEQLQARNFLELGVWKGAFAEFILRRCPSIERYYMLDPWQQLENWNKPANVDQASFDDNYLLTMGRTEFAGGRRLVLRGRTTDVIDEIPDEELDVAYIDGDHTLRGIAIDLIRSYSKVRRGGILGGDDYTTTIWQHPEQFEPSLVCPFAAYFAESQGAPIVILPRNQFAIIKPMAPGNHFRVIDTTKNYGDLALLPQITRRI